MMSFHHSSTCKDLNYSVCVCAGGGVRLGGGGREGSGGGLIFNATLSTPGWLLVSHFVVRLIREPLTVLSFFRDCVCFFLSSALFFLMMHMKNMSLCNDHTILTIFSNACQLSSIWHWSALEYVLYPFSWKICIHLDPRLCMRQWCVHERLMFLILHLQ